MNLQLNSGSSLLWNIQILPINF